MRSLLPLVFVASVVTTNICSSIAQQSDFDLDLYKRCHQQINELGCSDDASPGIRPQLETAVECNHDGWARYFANYCTMNTNGTRCATALAYHADFIRLFGTCALSFTTNCSDQCRNDLAIIRNDLGCCINAIFNYTDSPYAHLAPIFSYSLWSRCGLETVPTDCGTEGTIPYTLSNSQTVRCNSTQVVSRITEDNCQRLNISQLESELSPECRNISVQYFMDVCSRSPSGAYCITLVASDFTNYVTPIAANCSNRQNCNPSCRSLVSSLQSTRGCCINSLYNGTYAVAFGINYTYSILADPNLFSSCGVETPPLTCPSRGKNQQLETSLLFLPLIICIVSLLGN